MSYEDTLKTLRVDRFLEVGSNESLPYQHFTASGTMRPGCATGVLTFANDSTPIELTIPAPTDSGQIMHIKNLSTNTTAHLIKTAAGTTFDGSNNTATFDGPGDYVIMVSISKTQWLFLTNYNSVGLSST